MCYNILDIINRLSYQEWRSDWHCEARQPAEAQGAKSREMRQVVPPSALGGFYYRLSDAYLLLKGKEEK
jgi:hypothetical protein